MVYEFKTVFPLKRTILITFLLFVGLNLTAQHKDYENIKFKSKLRDYSKTKPKLSENDIDRELIVSLTKLLTEDIYNEKEQTDLINKIWLALSDPEKFDFVYKDYSIKTIDNWGVKIKFEDPNFEPNPFLYEWTVTADEYTYFQWALTRILTFEGLMAYGDESKTAAKNIKKLKLTRKTNFPANTASDHSYSYLARMNRILDSKGQVIIVYQNHFDFIACKEANKEGIIDILEMFKWHFETP